ncbi:MAG: hypothetical protein ABDH32_03450 [Candidatus Caldarchaeales archaeon]
MGIESLPIVFGFALLLGLFIFLLGYRSSNKAYKTHNPYNGGTLVKFTPYACGEIVPQILQSIGSRINLERFFLFAVYFLVLDVAIFMLILSFQYISIEVLIYTITILGSTLYMIR